jgi:glyoxylase-like metal-dependent hydrolase (beta-lactamase superfamily II)
MFLDFSFKKEGIVMKFLGMLFLLTVYGVSFEYHLKPYTVTEGVSCFFGLYGDAKEENGGRVVNTCYVESSEGYIVIDSGPTYQYAQQAYNVMQEANPLPVKYVINTTVQDTHVLGNEFYQERGAKLIGPESYYKLFNQNITSSISHKISKDAFSNTRLVPLDSYIKKDKKITLGDITIEIKQFNKENGRHLVAYFPKKQIVFVGNYVSNGQTPHMDKQYPLKGWRETLSEIENLSWNYLISSHGTKRDRTALVNTKKYLNFLVEKEEKSLKKKLEKQKKFLNIEMLATQKTAIKDKLLFNSEVTSINYTSFDRAKREAMSENKYIMVKVEASDCEPCVALNYELANNSHIKEMVRKHIKAVEIDADHDTIPMGLTYMGTPTVFLIEPKQNRVLMQLEGTLAAKDLENSLGIFLEESFIKGIASL